MRKHACRYPVAAAFLALSCASAWAQVNAPLTQAPAGTSVPAQASTPVVSVAPAQPAAAAPRPVVQAVAAPAPVPAQASAQPAATEAAFGDTTRLLIAAQGDGRRAGTDLPMLGEASTRAWERYMDSFSLPIPEWFNDQRGVTEQ